MTPSELQSENERLRAELEEAKAETCACLKFLECELGWEDFRAEMLYASKPEPRSTSERNAEKLLAFLKEKGHDVRFLAERDRLQRECLEWQAALHHAETEARQCGFTGAIREPGPALLEILAERDALKAQCESLLGDAISIADAELKRDEARAQAARLAGALAKDIRLGFIVRMDLPDYDEYINPILASTDARKWLREEIAKELERLVETFREMAWRAADGAKGETGMSMAFNEASHLIRERAAKLRREEG